MLKFAPALIALVFPLTLFADTKEQIEKLIEGLKSKPFEENGVYPGDMNIAAPFWKIGAPAIPYLLPLLQDPREPTREIAAYIVSGISGLKEADLDLLIAAQRRHNGWLPEAIAKIGTPKAIAFLVDELVRVRETQNQLTSAMDFLGPKAVPYLVEVYRNNDVVWDFHLENTLESVWGSLGAEAKGAIPPFAQMAEDASLPTEQRVRALMALCSIGPESEAALPTLRKLAESESTEIRGAAQAAILGTKTKEAVPILLEMLKKANADNTGGLSPTFYQSYVIREIGWLGSKSKSAGPVLLTYLNGKEIDLQIAAAGALGQIGDKAAVPSLVRALRNKEDWRLVLAAAHSLGWLQAAEAQDELMSVSKNHWYAPVREAASGALERIREARAPTNEEIDDSVYKRVERVPSLQEGEVERITLPVADEKGTMELEVEGGKLVATDKGEWGGDTTFVPKKGASQKIISGNTYVLFRTPSGIYAVTGLAHLSCNDGGVYRITRAANGNWEAERWRQLPAAPYYACLLKDGRLLVCCFGPNVLLSPDGTMATISKEELLGETR